MTPSSAPLNDITYLPNQIVTDGTSLFRIVDGRRIWLSDPPADQLVEMFEQQQRAGIARQGATYRPHPLLNMEQPPA